MFDLELPNAKRVKRSEALRSSPSRDGSLSPPPASASSSSQNAYTNASLYSQPWPKLPLNFEFTVEIKEPTALQNHDAASDPPEPASAEDNEGRGVGRESESFEFRLFRSFATQKDDLAQNIDQHQIQERINHKDEHHPHYKRSPPTTWITIRSPTPPSQHGDSSGGLVNPHRPRSYYFTSSGQDLHSKRKRRSEYASAAISGPALLSLAHSQKWPGTYLPFRVIHLPPSSSKLSSLQEKEAVMTGKGKRSSKARMGKKKRIAIRKRFAEDKAKEEKKTARNREKKKKKRERDKAKKREKREVAGAGSMEEEGGKGRDNP